MTAIEEYTSGLSPCLRVSVVKMAFAWGYGELI
jgi:hypothetical protein